MSDGYLKKFIKLIKLVLFFKRNWEDPEVRDAFRVLYNRYEELREILEE